MSKSPITTHVLDTAIGRPAAGVRITLEFDDGGFSEIASGVTDDDGRIGNLLEGSLRPGVYRMTFFVADYLAKDGREGFYPQVPVVFSIVATDEHYHVPLLLNPFGYSTYRGS
ncbi:MAG: hydroxyisourate hydrolase [Myxococcota bacterium]